VAAGERLVGGADDEDEDEDEDDGSSESEEEEEEEDEDDLRLRDRVAERLDNTADRLRASGKDDDEGTDVPSDTGTPSKLRLAVQAIKRKLSR
jgi:hypothetical protein